MTMLSLSKAYDRGFQGLILLDPLGPSKTLWSRTQASSIRAGEGNWDAKRQSWEKEKVTSYSNPTSLEILAKVSPVS